MNEVSLFLDEMISPSLVGRFWSESVDAVPARDRGLLSASDSKVWRYAQTEQRAVVTSNAGHFRALALDTNKNGSDHHGLLLIPNGGNRDEQFAYITSALTFVAQNNLYTPTFSNKIAAVCVNYSIHLEDTSEWISVPRKNRLH